MAKQINIDWDIKKMVKGKCTGVGCPIRDKCERFTSKEFDLQFGFLIPPHDSSGQFPKYCLNYLDLRYRINMEKFRGIIPTINNVSEKEIEKTIVLFRKNKKFSGVKDNDLRPFAVNAIIKYGFDGVKERLTNK